MKGRIISPGKCEGAAIVSKEPIGFYGGVDLKTGVIISPLICFGFIDL